MARYIISALIFLLVLSWIALPAEGEVYKPGAYYFSAYFHDSTGKINQSHQLQLKVSNTRWFLFQKKVIWLWEESKGNVSTTIEEETGVVDNDSEVWIHSPRMSVFAFMDDLPFPRVQYPIRLGDQWTRHRGMRLGKENDSPDFQSKYEVIALSNDSLKTARIRASSPSGSLAYSFNSQRGFYDWECELTDKRVVRIVLDSITLEPR